MLKRVLSKSNRVLLAELVRTDFKLRYQGSMLGYIWSLLRPLLIFLILYVVFVKLLKLGTGIPHYPVYLLFGIVLWNFFYEMTVLSVGSIVSRGDLIRKIRIPRWAIVISVSLSALINFALNLIVVAVFMFISHVHLTAEAFWLPLIILEIYVFALGISFFLSAAFVKFRDISYIWEVLLQAGFYATPVLYPLSRIHNITYQKLVLLNPLAQALQAARYVVVTNQTITANKVSHTTLYLVIPYLLIIASSSIGVLYFWKNSKSFAENI